MKHFILLVFAAVISSSIAYSADDLDLSAMIQPADSSLFIKDSLYYNWGSSIIKDNKGLYHIFYSRWPKEYGFYSWLTESEIAQATSTKPEGPYNNRRTVLQKRDGYWDCTTIHNVKIVKFGKTYYLYYTSTNSGNLNLTENEICNTGRTGYSSKYWGILRNNQRIGVAFSNNLDGTWKRLEHPLIEPSGPIKNITVNPTVCKGKGGKYFMIVKGDDANSNNWRLIQAICTSTSPMGPFKYEQQAAFSDIPTEDMSMWYDKGRKRFYSIFHAHNDNFIGLITSTDGIHWVKANHYKVCNKEILLAGGKTIHVDRMERPNIYIENGKPKILTFAVKKGDSSFIVIYKLENAQ